MILLYGFYVWFYTLWFSLLFFLPYFFLPHNFFNIWIMRTSHEWTQHNRVVKTLVFWPKDPGSNLSTTYKWRRWLLDNIVLKRRSLCAEVLRSTWKQYYALVETLRVKLNSENSLEAFDGGASLVAWMNHARIVGKKLCYRQIFNIWIDDACRLKLCLKIKPANQPVLYEHISPISERLI